MKKTLLLAGVISLLNFNANAQFYQQPQYNYSDIQNGIRTMFGIDYLYAMTDTDYQVHNFSFSGGIKLHPYFGVEAFFQKSLTEAENRYSNMKYIAYGLDFIGYIPLDSKFDLIGTIGIGNTEYSIEEYDSDVYSYNKEYDAIGYRIGLGGQYNFNDMVSARFMARYNFIFNDVDYRSIDSMIDLTAGLRLYFD
ncbi:MAG: outer membrane beta-barrel protein [Alphaproteobacteria bacterium]|nr:outer membrane beta-barrel protein [Alphaproteobacteria bacterium]